MKTYFLERLQIIPRSRGEAFAFFCDAFNLERWLNEIIDYRAVMTAHLLEVEDKVEELIERNRAIREVQKHSRPQARCFF